MFQHDAIKIDENDTATGLPTSTKTCSKLRKGVCYGMKYTQNDVISSNPVLGTNEYQVSRLLIFDDLVC